MEIERKNIQIKEIALSLDIDFDYLSSRPDGEQFANYLQKELPQTSTSVVIYLDFADVELMDGSFADEAFGTIAAHRSQNDINILPLILRNVDDVSLDNLELALLSRPARQTGLRNCVFPVEQTDGSIVLCGKYEDHVKQTFDLLNEHQQLTTRELAELLKLGTTASSTRLKVLHNLGLALRFEERDDKGRQFVYRSLV